MNPALQLLLTYPAIPLGIALFLVLIYTIYLHRKLHKFTKGNNAQSLESIILSCIESVKEIENRNELLSKHALSLEERLKDALRNAQTLRYKAFEANGSNQSFSIALLNEKGNGVVLSSLHARDRISTFAKPIEKYTSTYELTDEELHVIEESKKKHKNIDQ